MPAAPQPVEVRTEALRCSFGEREVLKGIDVEILAGEIVAIVGASGCGKTVLLNHLTGLMQAEAGRVLVANHHLAGSPLIDLATLDPDQLDEVRLFWSVVFQHNALFSGTVYDNIALWLEEHTGLTPEQTVARARESLAAAALDVDDVLNKDRGQLSGGMAKRVAIARAIAADPVALFYDEPTAGLDPVVSGHIQNLIWNTHHMARVRLIASPDAGDRPRTSVIVTHDKDLLRRIRPRVIMLDHGRVCFRGAYEAFESSSIPVVHQYLQAMPVLHKRDTV